MWMYSSPAKCSISLLRNIVNTVNSSAALFQQRLGKELGVSYRDNGRQGGYMPLKPTAKDKNAHGRSFESKQQGQLHRQQRGDQWPVGRSIGGRSGRKVEKKGDKSIWCVPSNLLRHALRQPKTSHPRYTIEAIQGSRIFLDVGLSGMQSIFVCKEYIVHQNMYICIYSQNLKQKFKCVKYCNRLACDPGLRRTRRCSLVSKTLTVKDKWLAMPIQVTTILLHHVVQEACHVISDRGTTVENLANVSRVCQENMTLNQKYLERVLFELLRLSQKQWTKDGKAIVSNYST